jgi:hypothetical protein
MTANLRPELAARLRQRLKAFGEGFRHNVALVGPRGSGKSFQLQQLVADPIDGLLLIYCPLYREPCRSFLQRLAASILRAGLPAARTAPADDELPSLLAAAATELPKTAAALAPVEGLLARRLYGEALSRTLDVIPVLVAERGQPCALVLDEFLYLEELGLVHAFHELGKRVMTWPSTLFVLTSSLPGRARAILRERLQLLFGQFELITLDSLEPDTASAWVMRELKGLRGVQGMVPFLIHWLGAYPWYLSVVVKRLKELAAIDRHRSLTDALLLSATWDMLGEPDGPLHQWCAVRLEQLSHARHGRRAMEILMALARGARTATDLGAQTGRAGLTSALQMLSEHELAQRNGTCWMIPDPALRCWLASVAAERSGARDAAEAARERCHAYLRGLWMRWLQTQQLTFTEQVAGLFAKFADDTVSLDSKTGRLPKFEQIVTRRPATPGPEAYLVADGQGRRWCAAIQQGPVDEGAITGFDAFCRSQTPKPTRKVLVAKSGMDENARVVAKTANMWVWDADDLAVLASLFEGP